MNAYLDSRAHERGIFLHDGRARSGLGLVALFLIIIIGGLHARPAA